MPDIRGVKHPDNRNRKEHLEWLRYLKNTNQNKEFTRYWINYGKGISSRTIDDL